MRLFLLTLMTIVLTFSITGCGNNLATIEDTSENETESTTQIETQGEPQTEIVTENDFTSWLPENVVQTNSETSPNILLQDTIKDYYQIPEEYWNETKYYYNYVDLNNDGKTEIFSVIIGSYTSGSGGSSALWCIENDGTMEILQAFTLVNTPIIISEADQSLILMRDSGTTMDMVKLVANNGIYTNIADADTIENIDTLLGTAIICNDLIQDMTDNNFLTLGDQ